MATLTADYRLPADLQKKFKAAYLVDVEVQTSRMIDVNVSLISLQNFEVEG